MRLIEHICVVSRRLNVVIILSHNLMLLSLGLGELFSCIPDQIFVGCCCYRYLFIASHLLAPLHRHVFTDRGPCSTAEHVRIHGVITTLNPLLEIGDITVDSYRYCRAIRLTSHRSKSRSRV